jgi:CheY-like chemotaxis protein
MPTLELPRLLITDDDAEFRETLRGALEPQGFWTLEAGDGEQALQIIHQQEVHVVLLDMHMPRLTGLETLRQLRRFRAVLPCILMSAQLDESIIEQAHREHAFSVLSKLATLRQLTATVHSAVEQTYRGRFGHG